MIPIFKIFEGLFKIPKGPKCAECQSVLIESDCPNMDCPIKVAFWVIRWASPEVGNIPIINDSIAFKLARLNLIIHPADLYELSESDWLQLDEVDKTKYKYLAQHLETSKKMSTESLLFGFRIKGVDFHVAQNLAKKFLVISKLRAMKIEDIKAVDSVSEETAYAIIQWFRDSFNKRILKMLDAQGFKID